MNDGSPFEEGVWLKGMLTVIVRGRDGRGCAGKRVVVKGCGFV